MQKLGEGAIWQENIDYLPSRFRAWLWEVLPFTRYGDKTSIPWQYVLYLSSGAVVGILVSLVTRRPTEDKLDYFYRLIRTPIRPGEEVDIPCTLPKNPLPPDTGKLIPLPGIEIPRPSWVGLGGFLVAWVIVGAILWLTQALAALGGS